MSRTYILVEGQTEEAFVNELLVPFYSPRDIYLTPIVVNTSPGHKGGVTSYAKIEPQIRRLCRQDEGAHVTTMFDLYALPEDFPGKAAKNYPIGASGAQKALFLEARLAQSVAEDNFIPNLMVHEFEALLFAGPECFRGWVESRKVVPRLSEALQQCGSPEDINDSPQTAPSKRILAAMPSYQKTIHGPLIACDIGLDAIRTACPHFGSWLARLEALR